MLIIQCSFFFLFFFFTFIVSSGKDALRIITIGIKLSLYRKIVGTYFFF